MLSIQNRILLVEDDFIFSTLQVELLQNAGYHVIHVLSGEEAVEFCSSNIDKIDLILMDIDLGNRIDGTIAAEQILKEHEIPLIFVSSHVDKEVVEKTEKITNYGYVVKNSGITVLDASIKMAFKLFAANKKIIAAKNKLEATLAALPDLLFEVGQDGCILDYNAPRKEFLYKPASDFIGKKISSILPAHVTEVIMSAISEADKKGFSVGKQYELTVPAGTLWFEMSVSRKTSTSPQSHFIIIVRDITDRKKAEGKIKRISQLYAALSQCNQAIIHCTSEAELFPQICRDAVIYGGLNMAWIGLVNEETKKVEIVASYGDEYDYLKDINISVDANDPNGNGPTGTAVRENEPYWCIDLRNDSKMDIWRELAIKSGLSSSAAIPLHRNSIVIGSLNVYATDINAFEEDIRKLLLEMVANISFALDNFARESARKQAERDLLRSEENLRKAQHFAHIGSWVWNVKTNQIDWSDEMFVIFGVDKKSFTGSLSDVIDQSIHSDDKSKVNESNQSVLKDGKRQPVEFRIIRSDSTVRIVWAEGGELIRDEDNIPFLLSGTVQDITDRKKADEQLRKLSRAIEQSTSSIVITDTKGNIEYVNRKFIELTGYTVEEAIEKKHSIFKYGFTSKEEYDELWNTILAGGEWRGEFLNKKKNGEFYWESTHISAIPDEYGEITHFLAIKEDITQKKYMEEQLKQSQKLEALGQIAGGIAHDFNNILAILMGNLELIIRKLPVDNSPMRKKIETSLSAVDRGAQLTKKLLAFARKQVFYRESVDLNLIIQDMFEMLERVLGKQIQIKLEISESPIIILIDKNEMENVILNLAINARDAMDNSGLLTIRTRKVENVKLSEKELVKNSSNIYAELSIIDTGTGIPPHLLQKIFEPFFTTKPKDKGTGLGLSLTYGFVIQSNGHINVYSEEGKGTCFKLYFPLYDVNSKVSIQSNNRPKESVLDNHNAENKNILVVDDESSMLNIANSILSSVGYNVFTSENVVEALEILKNNKIDLVLSDIIMPGEMNGIGLAKYINQNFPDIRIILTSGFPGHLHKKEADELRQYVFLEKPYKMEELESIVRSELNDRIR